MFARLFDLFVPNECLICHTSLERGEKGLCLVCQSKLPRTMCEKPDNEAEHRVFGKVKFEHGTSFCYYAKNGAFASLIKRAKYHDMYWINRHLAELFVADLSDYDWPFDIDVIVPVPIHFLRRFVRGYNQTYPIAEALSKAWHLPIDKKSLKKSVYTKSQVSRDAKERLVAVDSTFMLRNPDRFKGQHVLIVDDVLTTGATIEACGNLFVEAGAKISFLTLALSR